MRPRYPEGDEPAYSQRRAPVYRGQPQQQEMDDYAANSSGTWAAGGAPRRSSPTALWVLFTLAAFVILCLMGFYITSLYQAYPAFRQKAAIVEQTTFAQGVLVNDVHIGGMTKEQAEQALRSRDAENGNSLWLIIRANGKEFAVTSDEVPLERNTQAVLDTAYAIGRQGSKETIGSYVTPFEYRYAHLYHTVTAPVSLYTSVTYDNEKLWAAVRRIEAEVNQEPVNANVATFDFNTRAFTFTQEREGVKLDAENLYAQLSDTLNRRNYRGTINAVTNSIAPRVSKAELMNTFTLVSTYTTDTTSNYNRNTNIRLAAKAVNGIALMPGETFSFNQATGQRTEEKGYLPAAAITGGATVDEIGGGVCQVSSTLFNAAAIADMTILERSPHTWPSSYVEKGRDATVNWPNLDFKFRNDKDTPIFIVAYYQNQKCTVEIYGASLGAGNSIALTTAVTAVVDPPSAPVYERNPLLPYGTTQEKKKARTGYVVETYRVYRQNGSQVRRELLCTSNYPMIQQVIEYN